MDQQTDKQIDKIYVRLIYVELTTNILQEIFIVTKNCKAFPSWMTSIIIMV